ncbi:hypothetical protein D3C71_2199230 [compost metagenome]
MENGHIGHMKLLDELKQVFPAFSAIDPEFMLDNQQIGIGLIDCFGSIYIIGQ